MPIIYLFILAGEGKIKAIIYKARVSIFYSPLFLYCSMKQKYIHCKMQQEWFPLLLVSVLLTMPERATHCILHSRVYITAVSYTPQKAASENCRTLQNNGELQPKGESVHGCVYMHTWLHAQKLFGAICTAGSLCAGRKNIYTLIKHYIERGEKIEVQGGCGFFFPFQVGHMGILRKCCQGARPCMKSFTANECEDF